MDFEGASTSFRKVIEWIVFHLRLFFHLLRKFMGRVLSYSLEEVFDTFVDTVHVWYRFIMVSIFFRNFPCFLLHNSHNTKQMTPELLNVLPPVTKTCFFLARH